MARKIKRKDARRNLGKRNVGRRTARATRRSTTRRTTLIQKQNRRLSGLGGWLVLVLIIFISSFLSSIYLLAQKISFILLSVAGSGVYISAILLLVYVSLLFYSIMLMISKKKNTVKISIYAMIVGIAFSVWYDFIGVLAFYEFDAIFFLTNLMNLIVNSAIMLGIILYLKKSIRVRNTFR